MWHINPSDEEKAEAFTNTLQLICRTNNHSEEDTDNQEKNSGLLQKIDNSKSTHQESSDKDGEANKMFKLIKR